MYSQNEVKKFLKTKNKVLADIRKQHLVQGIDWMRKPNVKGYQYTMQAVKKLKEVYKQREEKLYEFVKAVKEFYSIKKVVGNRTNIYNAQIEYLKNKGYSIGEISKPLGCKEETLAKVFCVRNKEDAIYKLIKEEIFTIGEKLWEKI